MDEVFVTESTLPMPIIVVSSAPKSPFVLWASAELLNTVDSGWK